MNGLKISAACLCVLAAFAPAFAIHDTVPAETQLTLPGTDAAQLYVYITRSRPYTLWDLWPGKGKMYLGTQPHGDFLTTYVNDTAMFGIREKKGVMPEGTIIAKENYDKDKKFNALSVMYKVKGYNPAAADWFWAKYDKDGKVLASGRAEGCIKCHEKQKNNDYTFTGQSKK
ncbi:MAG: cytochrome P460 family protein [Nitrospirae bacterium]|nr:cytochrome P460 family protein [Nitrospirota bacterium]